MKKLLRTIVRLLLGAKKQSGKDMQNVTKVSDLTKEEVNSIVDAAFEFKKSHDCGFRRENILCGEVVAMVFEKPSLRTKIAFEVAATYLGGTPVFLSSSEILQSGSGERGRESIPDIARNLERFADLIIARVYEHKVIEQLASSVKIPIVNALCDSHHPTQALADIMAIRMHKPNQQHISVAFVGDGTNVATSLLQICALVGINCYVASPEGFEIPDCEQEVAKMMAQASGSKIACVRNPIEVITGADVVYTDTFLSMGLESQRAIRENVFKPYCVDAKLMSYAKEDAVFMHCLPAHRGEEVTDEVMDCERSIVFDQAECRLHVAKALLARLLRRD